MYGVFRDTWIVLYELVKVMLMLTFLGHLDEGVLSSHPFIYSVLEHTLRACESHADVDVLGHLDEGVLSSHPFIYTVLESDLIRIRSYNRIELFKSTRQV